MICFRSIIYFDHSTYRTPALTCPGTKGPRGAPATAADDGTEDGPSAAAAAAADDAAAAARLAYLGSRDRRSS